MTVCCSTAFSVNLAEAARTYMDVAKAPILPIQNMLPGGGPNGKKTKQKHFDQKYDTLLSITHFAMGMCFFLHYPICSTAIYLKH